MLKSFFHFSLFNFLSILSIGAKDTNQLLESHNMLSKIDRTIDSNFIYDYEKTKFVPPNGKTIFIMGQTVEGISDFQYNFKDQIKPAGWSAYWGITEFKGIDRTHYNETGTSQNHQMLVDSFPNTVIHSALWMVGKWDIDKNVVKGNYDKVIKKYCKWAKKIKRPIYLRIGYEFDGPHNELDPDEYRAAYKYIVDYMRKKNVNNIAFVWHSYASKPYQDYPLSSWYPGDDYVDWVAISVFGHAYSSDFGPYCDDVLEFAKARKKPVMIAESSPINGINKYATNVWESWFMNYFSFIYQTNIKAVCFINEDWTKLKIDGISNWGNAKLGNNKIVSQSFFKELENERFLKQSKELFNFLDYKKVK